jgi:hypothetical protein
MESGHRYMQGMRRARGNMGYSVSQQKELEKSALKKALGKENTT